MLEQGGLQVFKFKSQETRIVMMGDEPWWVAKDVCEVLGIQNVTQAVTQLDEDERSMFNIGRQGEVNIVNEPGLYTLILGSRKPEAKDFKRWITHEIMPSIRKHGAYMTAEKIEEVLLNPDTIIQLAQNLKAEQEKRRELEDKIDADRPKVLFAESVEASSTSILVGDFAKILRQNGYEIGQKRLFKCLRDRGYLMKQKRDNIPTQRSMEAGWFEIKEIVVSQAERKPITRITTKMTGKGQVYFANLFLKGKIA